MTEQTVRKSITTISCPACGGRPVWNPETASLKCPFCGHVTEVEQTPVRPAEYDINSAPTADQQDWGVAKRVTRCQSCGAETILDATETARLCAFCGSPHVLDDQSEAGIAPETVIPFTVGKETAAASFHSWLKGKLFSPSKAKKAAQLDHVTGVYLPHWTYDDDASATYVGREGHYYYVNVPVTVTRDGKTRTEMRRERRTRWVPTAGAVANYFDDVVIPGSERLPADLLERVQPYDLTKLCDYRAEFLSGFAAEKPAVDVKRGWDAAKERIESALRNLARQDILSRADEADVTILNAKHAKVRYKLTLLPMYLSSFRYKDKLYHVLVNGQNGKCGGQAPVSALRVLIAVLLAAAAIAGIYLWLEGA